jgi:hypothetical protein
MTGIRRIPPPNPLNEQHAGIKKKKNSLPKIKKEKEKNALNI